MEAQMTEQEIREAVNAIAEKIVEDHKTAKKIILVGIITRGVELAGRMAETIQKKHGKSTLVGALDIKPYRDDLKLPEGYKSKTRMPFDVTMKKVILVDDVLYTGRSVRAAMDALIEYGRPSEIHLAVLVDRGHREFPIHADYVGKKIPTASTEKVKVRLKETDGKDEVVIIRQE
ncbi:MAG: bifunctional pyr operon transcriptional regulator/uracil phosphoribosyltransferase PyrR [Candidatus Altiarchaeota archaeon]|nr:bifunctional pyr operon transcriptional regulator/uracil phosphoribosyltransferase PyrR [Candidatus Altiarchaeota archaeon]